MFAVGGGAGVVDEIIFSVTGIDRWLSAGDEPETVETDSKVQLFLVSATEFFHLNTSAFAYISAFTVEQIRKNSFFFVFFFLQETEKPTSDQSS